MSAGELVHGDQVDARVVLAVASRPFLPKVDLAELIRVRRICTEVLRDQSL